MTVHSSITIAIADDDEDDRLLIEDAFRESRLINPRIYAKDGVELMDRAGSTVSDGAVGGMSA